MASGSAVAVVVGWPIAFLAIRALHRLTGRFVVFVPHGLVVHDLMAMREPVPFASGDIAAFGPAPADTTATDLTSGALGLALEVSLGSTATIPLVTGRTDTEERSVRAVLIAPSRPAAVLAVGADRGLRIA
ncbi:MAG: hypothetical protein R2695_01955 [Acidimicrobiales bacterium]